MATKEIKVIDLKYTGDTHNEESIKEVAEKCLGDVASNHSFVNLIKVTVNDAVRESEVSHLMASLHKMFIEAGVSNAVLVPINSSIRDITVDKIEVEHK